jgi:segregation and condensation protein A
MDKLKNENVNSFSELMEKCECKLECVVTFLALLEMIKQRMVKVYQSDNFMKILIERRAEDD